MTANGSTKTGKVALATLMGTAALAGSLFAGSATAEEVYRWTDKDGTVHFSDRPPTTEQKSLTTMTVNGQAPASYDPDEDRYNVEATAARTQAMRDQQAQSRQQQNSTPAPVVQYAQPQAYDVGYGYPPYYDRPGMRPPQRPDRPVRPEPEPPPTATLKPVRTGRRN